jgi:hypothetical protein
MPRFFFHLTDGNRTFTDANGVELRNMAAVRKHLISHIQELRGALSDNGIHDWSEWTILVLDEKNITLQAIGLDLKPKIMTA